MRYFITIIIGVVIAIAIFMTEDWKGIDLSLSSPSEANTITGIHKKQLADSETPMEYEGNAELWIDTVMYAKEHTFGYSGDVSMWGGWYLDTICVGNDNMMKYDIVGPSTLKLSLVTRVLTVDLGESDIIRKIKSFLSPIDGFRRFSKRYDECLDSLFYEGYGYDKYMGGFSFEVDYPDSCNENAGKINRFICELTKISDSEMAKVPGLAAFYAGFNQIRTYRRVFSGNTNNIEELSDFLAHRTFENWKRGGNFGMGSNDATLAIRPHISNKRYITFSRYEYDREGTGHGMYTETFHSFDLMSEKRLKNKDIFKSQSLDKVKMKLFEVMAKDPHYLEWHGESVSAKEIESIIKAWQSPSPDLEDTEWEEPQKELKFDLPECALTEAGIIFSFQPYEIDCWAAGAYHFIVPYSKLQPYMTSQAKRLCGI